LSPAIAIEQKTASHNPRSTVGTVTEIYDYLRLLFARVGVPHCYQCGKPIAFQSLDQIIESIFQFPDNSRSMILAPLVSGQKGSHERLFQKLKKDGFARVKVDGVIYEIDDLGKLDKNKKHAIDVIVDRLVINEKVRNRLADSLEMAISLSGGVVTVDRVDSAGKIIESILFSEKAACISCGISYPELTPASFSFNSPRAPARNATDWAPPRNSPPNWSFRIRNFLYGKGQ
jgi:excinuclease ABC subunit A